MNAQNARNTSLLCDNELDTVSGGGARIEVTQQEYERILAKMIADSKKGAPTCPR